ncbi:MAG TPA: hypothetical protein VHM20_06025 [Gammaproteobacteria bacterium]|jgi:Tfp pilus assembly major pilin PilA|nr:hypothetical protein [Gammaproteobacteria bacterium]
MRQMLRFSFKELIIAIIVIGLLGTIAYPAYQNFSRRLVYAEILKNLEPLKVSIAECYKVQKKLSECDSGKNHIANNIQKTGPIELLSVTDGTITVIPTESNGILQSDNYILTPMIKNGEIQWIASGKAILNAYAS